MDSFATVVNGSWLLTIVPKLFLLDVLGIPLHASKNFFLKN